MKFKKNHLGVHIEELYEFLEDEKYDFHINLTTHHFLPRPVSVVTKREPKGYNVKK